MRFSKITRNALSLFGAQIYSKFIAVLFFPIAARILGVSDFGKYTLVLTFISFFYILADWGLSVLTIRDIARSPKDTKTYLTQTIALRCLLALLFYIGLICIALLLNYPNEIILLISIMGVSLLTNNILNSLNAIFSAQEKMHIPSILGIIFSSIFFVSGIFCLYTGLGLIGLISVSVFLTFINTFITACLLKKYLFPFRFSLNFRLLKSATPYAVLSLLSIIYFKIDTVMLSKLKSIEAVGLYNSSYKIIEFLRFIPICIMGAYFPQMARLAQSSVKNLRESYKKSTIFLLLLILPIAILCTIFAKKIIYLLFGDQFIAAAASLKILIWAAVIMFANAPLGNLLYNSNKLAKFIPFALANTFLNVILNFIFIPKYSFIGASYTTLLTEITGLCIQLWFVKEILFKK